MDMNADTDAAAAAAAPPPPSAFAASSTTADTTVSLWFAKNANNDSVSVSAWALHGMQLLYSTLVDRAPKLTVLTDWIQRWQPSVVHVASAAPLPHDVMMWLEHLREELSDVDVNVVATAVPNTTRIVRHDSLPKQVPKMAPDLIKQLVEGNTAATLAVAANVDLAPHSQVLQGFALLLQGLGWWSPSLDPQHVGRFEILPDAGAAPFLLLDHTAAKSMNVWPIAHQGEAAAQGMRSFDKDSLFGILTAPSLTSMGKRLLHQWLRQPLTKLAALQRRQDAVAHLVKQNLERDGLRGQGLKPLQLDLSKLAQKLGNYENLVADGGSQEEDNDDDELIHADQAAGATVSQGALGSTAKALKALYELYLVASQKIPALVEQMEGLDASLREQDETMASSDKQSQEEPPILIQLCHDLRQVALLLRKSQGLGESVIDLSKAPREFVIQPEYRDELQDVAQELERAEEEVKACHCDMNDIWAQASGSSGKDDVRLEWVDADDEYQFRLANANHAKILQNELRGTVQMGRILKNGVYFTTKELLQCSEEKRKLIKEYEKEQRAVVKDAMAIASSYRAVLEQASALVAHIDALSTLAHVAAYSSNGYVRPEMTDSDEDGAGIVLQGARHPCVELQDNKDYIPNDVSLLFGESSFLLVTGPNMGGKSTYIRALGAIVTMAQMGSFVPCTAAKINICHHILARVGAGDLQNRGISTFMAEMLESNTILRTASKRSLIVIDELGRGTSTFDGYGLARAISEYIVQKIGCMTIFATHFHELTALEEQQAGVKNCHVTAHAGSQGLTFLYEVRPGPCLESFGIQVAEMANVPNVVVQDAKIKAKELENFEYHQARNSADEPENMDLSDDADEHASAEETAAAVAFLNGFRRLSVPEILARIDLTDEQREAALLLHLGSDKRSTRVPVAAA